jgi:ataxin-3
MPDCWIYHEKQQAQLCGQHALNNLLQVQTFTPDGLAQIAHQLGKIAAQLIQNSRCSCFDRRSLLLTHIFLTQIDQMELNFMSAGNKNGIASKDYLQRIAEGSGNVDASGNFSIEVLRSALLSQFNLTLANTLQETVRTIEITDFDGFICNKQSHWFAIRKVNGRYWNLNSIKDRPEQISHFRLAAEIEALRNEGYSVFCVVEIGQLPSECMHVKELAQRGAKEFWWSEIDLLKGKSEASFSSNAWSNVGNGMRLDGRSPTSTENHGTNPNKGRSIEGLTEEEMIEMAMSESLQAGTASNQNSVQALDLSTVMVPLEPAQGAEGAVRIQFRLPDGKRITRRFLKSESVKVLAAFVQEQCPEDGKTLEMRAGFPPKVISSLYESSIETAQLSGESIQCRYS